MIEKVRANALPFGQYYQFMEEEETLTQGVTLAICRTDEAS